MTTPAIYTATALTLVAAGLAAAWDLGTRKIPNWLTFPTIALGLVLNLVGAGLPGLRNAVLGTVAGTALLLAPFAVGGLGAGDVKMLAAVGALNGAAFAFRAFLYGAVAGGLIAAVVIGMNRYRRSYTRSFGAAPVEKRTTLPYGIAIFAGTVAAYFLR